MNNLVLGILIGIMINKFIVPLIEGLIDTLSLKIEKRKNIEINILKQMQVNDEEKGEMRIIGFSDCKKENDIDGK